MKIKNLAFCGVMASILGVGAAYADNDATVIASKAYVDAVVEPKEDEANKVKKTWAQVTPEEKISTDLYPSMATLSAATAIDKETNNVLSSTNTTHLPTVDAVQKTAQRADSGTVTGWSSTTASDVLFPTVKAVAQQIEALDVAGIDNTTGDDAGVPIVKVTEADGKVSVAAGQVSNAGLGDSSVTFNKFDNTTVEKAIELAVGATTISDTEKWNATDEADDKFPTVKAVAQQIEKATNIDAESNNVLEATDNTKLTKVAAIKSAVSSDKLTSVDASGAVSVGNGSNTQLATTSAIADTFKDLDSKNTSDSTAQAKAITAVSQTDGQVTVTAGTLSATAIDSSAKENSNVITSTGTTKLVEVGGVQATIAKQGNLSTGWNQTFTESAASEAGATNLYTAVKANDGANMDNYIPTIKAVEQRINYGTDGNASAVYDSTGKTVTIAAAGGGGNQNKSATSSAVAATATALKSAIDIKLNKNDAITAKNNSIVNYDANGLVTGGLVLEDVAGDGLTGVNGEAQGESNCSTSNPCVLTYLGGTGSNAKYRWTGMDTNGLTAQ